MSIKGRICKPERLITAKIDMEDVVPKGFEALLNNKSENIKILISPTRIKE
jgi:(R,R)-butanediol dehydrogenase/meso-butanediol dehydrogenase/diacetyl reductase